MPKTVKKVKVSSRLRKSAEYWQKAFRARRRFIVAVSGLVLVFLVALGLFNVAYAGKIYPGVIVGGIKAGGMTKEELAGHLDQKVQSVHDTELKVVIDGREFTLTPTKDWQLSYDISRTVNRAYGVGRGKFGTALKSQFMALFSGVVVPADYAVNQSRYRTWIEDRTKEAEDPEQDAKLIFKDGRLTVEPEKSGRRILGDSLSGRVSNALSTINFAPITIELTDVQPAVTSKMADRAKPAVAKMIDHDLVLTFEARRFSLKSTDLLGFFELAADPSAPEGIAILVSEAKVMQKIEEIAKNIDQSPVDAKLSISGGRASVFTPSRDGYRVKRDESAKNIADALKKRRSDIPVKEIALAVEVTRAAVRTDTINDLGIKELIGKGTTSFAGSPPNRIHNITVGANSFHGLIIKPGETFSTIAALGSIDESTGYRAELVIKEDRLIPETGGGLCQVSTTLFRAALNAGLPIIERRNHSFRVRYYEPPIGMDATIYDPAPDLKFTNDTPGHILIQTKVEGTKITFELYGTSDGRVAKTTTPLIYNIVQPGDPVYIEDPTLAPGELVQIEKAVPGADARFTYTVVRDGKTIYTKTFTSHYVAWRAKYRVGPAAPPAEFSETSPDSTPTP